jgi:hypothetical protein
MAAEGQYPTGGSRVNKNSLRSSGALLDGDASGAGETVSLNYFFGASGPPQLTLTTTATSTGSLTIESFAAPAVIPLNSAAGTTTGSAAVTATTTVTLAAAAGTSTTSAAVTASPKFTLSAAGTTTTALTITTTPTFALSATATSTTSLAVTATTTVTLGASAATSTASLAAAATTTVSLSPANGVSSASLGDILTIPRVTATSSAESGGSCVITVPLDPVFYDGGIVPGFVTDQDGYLAVHFVPETVGWFIGFLRWLFRRNNAAGQEIAYRPLQATSTLDGTPHGEVVAGFVTDSDGHLVMIADPTGSVHGEVVAGFVTSPNGELIVTETPESPGWQEGFIRDENGALAIRVVEDAP